MYSSNKNNLVDKSDENKLKLIILNLDKLSSFFFIYTMEINQKESSQLYSQIIVAKSVMSDLKIT